MHTKLAKNIQPGDFILLDDERPVCVLNVGRGLWPDSVLIDFDQPKIGPNVSPAWACVDRAAEVSVDD